MYFLDEIKFDLYNLRIDYELYKAITHANPRRLVGILIENTGQFILEYAPSNASGKEQLEIATKLKRYIEGNQWSYFVIKASVSNKENWEVCSIDMTHSLSPMAQSLLQNAVNQYNKHKKHSKNKEYIETLVSLPVKGQMDSLEKNLSKYEIDSLKESVLYAMEMNVRNASSLLPLINSYQSYLNSPEKKEYDLAEGRKQMFRGIPSTLALIRPVPPITFVSYMENRGKAANGPGIPVAPLPPQMGIPAAPMLSSLRSQNEISVGSGVPALADLPFCVVPAVMNRQVEEKSSVAITPVNLSNQQALQSQNNKIKEDAVGPIPNELGGPNGARSVLEKTSLFSTRSTQRSPSLFVNTEIDPDPLAHLWNIPSYP